MAEQGTPVVDPQKVVTMLHGFVITVEDNSRGTFSDDAAHRHLAAIHRESEKMLTILRRPDLLAELGR